MVKTRSGKLKASVLSDYPDMLTVENLCELLHVGKKSIYGMMKRGELKYAKVGRGYVSTKKWLKECMERQSCQNLNIAEDCGKMITVPKDEPAERSLVVNNGR